MRVLGIEPAANVASLAVSKGIPTLARFFGTELAAQLRSEGRTADLLAGNNVLAHVPDVNDFVAGLAKLLAERGVLTMEFPHVARLIAGSQFATIYHEHFSYCSFAVAVRIFKAHGSHLRRRAAHARGSLRSLRPTARTRGRRRTPPQRSRARRR